MTRPSSDRDGACICDYNPATTDGPQEDCPFHGRPYTYWVERGDVLATRLATAADTVLAEARRLADEHHVASTEHGRIMALGERLAAAVLRKMRDEARDA